jgi:putative chitinase
MFLEPLNQTLEKYQINTPLRCSMFLAQIGHESGQLQYTEELDSGEAYEDRKDLGNSHTGDGVKYKGRGLIQITGRKNYVLCSLSLDLPLLENPELLASVPWAALSAGWFWNNNNLNSLADCSLMKECTRRINGGMNGWDDRLKLYNRALQVFK